jgi:hypothetical protein
VETLKHVFIIKSTKECMSILLPLNFVFDLWETIFVEWDKCNILDGNADVQTSLSTPIEKSTFGYLSNMKEK